MGATPPGIAALVNARGGRNYSTAVYRTVVLVLTFGSYTLYHATRKPMSIVKGTLRDGWAPFTGEDGNSLLGSIDVAFLATYAVGMFFSGHVADTMDLRVFLTVGMLGSGLFTAVFGLCYFYDVHDVWVFYAIQVPCPLLALKGGLDLACSVFPPGRIMPAAVRVRRCESARVAGVCFLTVEHPPTLRLVVSRRPKP